MFPTPQTPFTRDILGNYVCNLFSEAQNSGPFDVVIIGGGTFGLALAQDLLFRTQRQGAGAIPEDGLRPASFRILVLEAGPFALNEHTQDIPNLQLYPPGTQPGPGSALPATRQELIAQGLQAQPILENWGLPWNSTERFGGLAYCVGGRSLYFGGWSPRYLATEMHRAAVGAIGADTLWPAAVVEDLTLEATINDGFELQAAQQTGVSAANDFINGTLHDFLRRTLFANYGAVPNAIPLAEMPDYTVEAPQDITAALSQQLAAPPYPGFRLSLALDAPLSVQAVTRPGFFPFNKFSSVPLGITASRAAFGEAGTNNAAKRLMIVPNCHVKRLMTRPYVLATGAVVQEVIGIDTGNGPLDLSGAIAGNANRRPVVVLAAGAIESARLAMLSVAGVPNGAQMGRNLMVHLRKNVSFTIAPLPAGLPPLADQELSALLVRCRANLPDGTPAHFHLQITASAVPPGPAGGGRSDALLFQSVPDLDHVRIFSQTAPAQLDVAIRAVGEMLPNPQNNNVVLPLPADNDEYNMPRATVNVVRSARDNQLMGLMDATMDAVAQNIGIRPPAQRRGAAAGWPGDNFPRVRHTAHGRKPGVVGNESGWAIPLRGQSLRRGCLGAADLRVCQPGDERHRGTAPLGEAAGAGGRRCWKPRRPRPAGRAVLSAADASPAGSRNGAPIVRRPVYRQLAHGGARHVSRCRRRAPERPELRPRPALVHDPDASELPAGAGFLHSHLPDEQRCVHPVQEPAGDGLLQPCLVRGVYSGTARHARRVRDPNRQHRRAGRAPEASHGCGLRRQLSK